MYCWCTVLLLCKNVLIHDLRRNSVLFLLVNTGTGNPDLMTTSGNVPLFQALSAFTGKINSVGSLISSMQMFLLT